MFRWWGTDNTSGKCALVINTFRRAGEIPEAQAYGVNTVQEYDYESYSHFMKVADMVFKQVCALRASWMVASRYVRTHSRSEARCDQPYTNRGAPRCRSE